MKKTGTRKPRSLKLEDGQTTKGSAVKDTKPKPSDKGGRKPRASAKLEDIEFTPLTGEDFPDELELLPQKPAPSSTTWKTIFMSAAGLLASLWLGLTIEAFVRELFSRNEWLGWLALSLSTVLFLGALFFLLREIWAISRLNTINRIRARAEQIIEGHETQNTEGLIKTMQAIFDPRSDMATSRAAFNATSEQIINAPDRLALFERHYLAPLDMRAQKLVMASAKRVSVVTAISPRAIIDVGYVLVENTRLIRQISQTYGGRPGYFGFWRLTANILAHLAMTGVIAAGDSLVQQIVGHGVAARISSRIGEGVVNGLLTARIGLAAMDQSRPMPFYSSARPQVRDYFTSLVEISKGDSKENG